MARIRTIKPSFWSDSKVAALTMEERLLLVGLISSADDAGRFVATTVQPNNGITVAPPDLPSSAEARVPAAPEPEHGDVPLFEAS